MPDFEVELLTASDETLSFCLGNINVQILYQYMERKGCPKQEIPNKLDFFDETLEKLIGRGRGQILGVASVLENSILKELCKKLEIKHEEVGPGYFPEQCKKLRNVYLRTKNSRHSQKP